MIKSSKTIHLYHRIYINTEYQVSGIFRKGV